MSRTKQLSARGRRALQDWLQQEYAHEPLTGAQEEAIVDRTLCHLIVKAGLQYSIKYIRFIDSPRDLKQFKPPGEAFECSAQKRILEKLHRQVSALTSDVAPTYRSGVENCISRALPHHHHAPTEIRDGWARSLQYEEWPENWWLFDGIHPSPHILPNYVWVLKEAYLNQLNKQPHPLPDALLQLTRQTSIIHVDNKVAYVVRHPVEIKTNVKGALHCEDGAAVTFKDGYQLAFIDGIQLPVDLIKRPERIQPLDILFHPNMEIRRVLLERMGIDTFLNTIQAKPVAQDDFGTLYVSMPPERGSADFHRIRDPRSNLRLGFAGTRVEPLAFVKLINSTPEPGTDDVFKEYLLRVPPEMRTPRQAVAWSFDSDESSYAPVFQS
jgi:hypothetical protein